MAFVVDAYARRILGWRVASTMATSMVLDAIEQSIWTRQQEGVLDLKDVVHHTDRGHRFTGSTTAASTSTAATSARRTGDGLQRVIRVWANPSIARFCRLRFVSLVEDICGGGGQQ
jgi:hypothetical protein